MNKQVLILILYMLFAVSVIFGQKEKSNDIIPTYSSFTLYFTSNNQDVLDDYDYDVIMENHYIVAILFFIIQIVGICYFKLPLRICHSYSDYIEKHRAQNARSSI